MERIYEVQSEFNESVDLLRPTIGKSSSSLAYMAFKHIGKMPFLVFLIGGLLFLKIVQEHDACLLKCSHHFVGLMWHS